MTGQNEMKKINFKKRIENVEVHSCNEHLLSDPPHTQAEIIKTLSDGYNFTLAYWIKDSEGFDLRFVGNRPFDVKPKTFMKLARFGQKKLDKYFDEKVEK